MSGRRPHQQDASMRSRPGPRPATPPSFMGSLSQCPSAPAVATGSLGSDQEASRVQLPSGRGAPGPPVHPHASHHGAPEPLPAGGLRPGLHRPCLNIGWPEGDPPRGDETVDPPGCTGCRSSAWAGRPPLPEPLVQPDQQRLPSALQRRTRSPPWRRAPAGWRPPPAPWAGGSASCSLGHVAGAGHGATDPAGRPLLRSRGDSPCKRGVSGCSGEALGQGQQAARPSGGGKAPVLEQAITPFGPAGIDGPARGPGPRNSARVRPASPGNVELAGSVVSKPERAACSQKISCSCS